jgi:hypothetical protein
MVPIAPRYDRLIRELADALDDRSESMAETCRRVGEVVEAAGLFRPSYVHLRRFLSQKRRREDAERMRRRELRQIAADVYVDATLGYRIDGYELAERIREANRRRARGSEPQAH